MQVVFEKKYLRPDLEIWLIYPHFRTRNKSKCSTLVRISQLHTTPQRML